MNETRQNLKKIPYGISNYNLFRDENYYYVDKTAYIGNIEDKGRFLLFIRPRRFGKSLFLSTMETYYDISQADRFDYFFQGTAVHETPTPGKNSYLVLKLDFSAVDPDVSQVEAAFFTHIKNSADFFLDSYGELLNIDLEKAKAALNPLKSPAALMDTFLNYCKGKKQKLYVIIDEYDNFANTILSTAGEHEYRKITHGEGFLRAFFNALKSGTSGSKAAISRLFMTGVSPITLDDVTSGFNIAKNISLDPDIDEMLGFTPGEVESLIEYYKQTGKIHHSSGEIMDIMTDWYNHYRFSMSSHRGVFNSVQVLYFLDQYLTHRQIPDPPIDRNVRIDYHKLRHLIIIDQKGATKAPKSNGNFSRLMEIVENGSVQSAIVKGFPVAELTEPENFISLLYYFGLLTIDGTTQSGKAVLSIPNETVKRLYYDYVKETYEETQVFTLDLYRYSQLMEGMAFDGQWAPLIEYLAERIEAAMGLRDLISREKALQAFLNVYLGLSPLYIIHSEREMKKGFADLVLEPTLVQYPGIRFAYLVEIKYIKSAAAESESGSLPARIQALKEEAEEQLRQYCGDEKFQKAIGDTKLVKLVLIFCGPRLVYKGETL